MSAPLVESFKPDFWIRYVVIGFITFIVNSSILYKEIRSRKKSEVKFTTKYLKIWSIASIISGTLFGFFQFTLWFPVFCYFGPQLIGILITAQAIFMGFYQLSRLYYCFAKDQVYSDNGYSNCLFIVMYGIGFLFLLWSCIYSWFTDLRSICGMDNEWNLYYQYKDADKNKEYRPITGGSGLILLIWDIVTLILYIYKVISFRKYKKEKPNVHERIMNILNRILILTIMYEIINLIGSLLLFYSDTLFWFIFGGLSSVIYSYSMVLMQQHNNEKYQRFIKIIYSLKLHYVFICCCCCVVSYVNTKAMDNSDQHNLAIHVTNKQQEKKDESICETQQNTPNDQKIDVDPFENSIDTKTAAN